MDSILSYPLKIHDIDENKIIIKKNSNIKKNKFRYLYEIY